MPVVPDPAQFDRNSGNWLERLIFNHRLLILALCALLTAFFGWHASQLRANANFEKMIPRSHPYIRNYFDNKSALAALGNSVRIAVENTRGDVFDPEYLAVLQKVNDTAFLMPGVDR